MGPVSLSDYSMLWNISTGGIVESSPIMVDLQRRGDGSLADACRLVQRKRICDFADRARSLWQTQLNSPVLMVSSADPEDDGKVEVLAGTTDGRLVCLDSAGKILWTFHAGGAIISPPLELNIDNTARKKSSYSDPKTENIRHRPSGRALMGLSDL